MGLWSGLAQLVQASKTKCRDWVSEEQNHRRQKGTFELNSTSEESKINAVTNFDQFII